MDVSKRQRGAKSSYSRRQRWGAASKSGWQTCRVSSPSVTPKTRTARPLIFTPDEWRTFARPGVKGRRVQTCPKELGKVHCAGGVVRRVSGGGPLFLNRLA